MGFIIFSVDRSELREDQNLTSRSWLVDQLTNAGIPFQMLNGCYEGRTEKSYLVADIQESIVKKICEITKQDCYIKVDNNKNAEIVNKWGDAISIGLWQQVTRSVAESLSGYTKFRNDYYVASTTLYPRPAYKSGI